MRLIDADRLDKELSEEDYIKEGEMLSEYVDRMRSIIDNQPTIYPLISGGRSCGKKLFADYYNICKVLDHFGLDSTNPAKELASVLEQYQKIVCELTGGFFSKLTYDADVIIAKVQDIQNEDIRTAVAEASNSEDADAPKPTCYKCIHHTFDSGVLYCRISHGSARQRLFEESCDCFEPELMYKDEFTTDKET